MFVNMYSLSQAENLDNCLLENTVRMVCAEHLTGDSYTSLMTYDVFNVRKNDNLLAVYLNVFGASFEADKDYYVSDYAHPYCFIFVEEDGCYHLNCIRFPGDGSNPELSYEEEIDQYYMGNYDSYPGNAKIVYEDLTHLFLQANKQTMLTPVITQKNKSYVECPAIIENEIIAPLWGMPVYNHATNTVCSYTSFDDKFHVSFTYVNGDLLSESSFALNNNDNSVVYYEGSRLDGILDGNFKMHDSQ